MHLLVPFAAVAAEGGRAALRELALPNLKALLGLLGEPTLDTADEWSLSPPHERALARAAGLQVDDGCVPMAVLIACRDAQALGPGAWGWVTPSHWRLGTEQVSLTDPGSLALGETESRAFFDAVRPVFEDEGFVLQWRAPVRWLVSHPSLDGMPCASLDRAIGRNIDAWLATDPRVRLVRRLQSEVQMLLYTHPLNDVRDGRGDWPVNSFWLSGCGAAPDAAWPAGLVLDERLRGPALAEDWFAWSRAWHALDDGPVAALLAQARSGGTAQLTLCGETAAATYTARPRSLFDRLGGAFRRAEPVAALESL